MLSLGRWGSGAQGEDMTNLFDLKKPVEEELGPDIGLSFDDTALEELLIYAYYQVRNPCTPSRRL